MVGGGKNWTFSREQGVIDTDVEVCNYVLKVYVML